jgi:hypothetical protein
VSIGHGLAIARMMDSVLLHTDPATSISHSRPKDQTPYMVETRRIAAAAAAEDLVAVDEVHYRVRTR